MVRLTRQPDETTGCLLLRPTDPVVSNFSDETDQSYGDRQEAEKGPNRKWVRSTFGIGNKADAKGDYADGDEIRQYGVHSPSFSHNQFGSRREGQRNGQSKSRRFSSVQKYTRARYKHGDQPVALP